MIPAVFPNARCRKSTLRLLGAVYNFLNIFLFYKLVILFSEIVRLILEFTFNINFIINSSSSNQRSRGIRSHWFRFLICHSSQLLMRARPCARRHYRLCMLNWLRQSSQVYQLNFVLLFLMANPPRSHNYYMVVSRLVNISDKPIKLDSTHRISNIQYERYFETPLRRTWVIWLYPQNSHYWPMFRSCILLQEQRLKHGRMARGGHGLPKVLTGPVMPCPSTPCGRVTPETALCSFQGWPTCRVGGLRPSFIPLDTPRHTPMVWNKSRLWGTVQSFRTSSHEVLEDCKYGLTPVYFRQG